MPNPNVTSPVIFAPPCIWLSIFFYNSYFLHARFLDVGAFIRTTLSQFLICMLHWIQFSYIKPCQSYFKNVPLSSTSTTHQALSLHNFSTFNQGCQSGLITGGVVGPGLKTGGVVFFLKKSTNGGAYNRIEGIIFRFFLNYMQIIIFLKSRHFWRQTCSHLIF